tara:strand:- start:9 stop:467 length:459 start_codon:yes stop_codon:yes gene_type:complete
MDNQKQPMKRLDMMGTEEAETLWYNLDQLDIRTLLDTLESMKAERKLLNENIGKVTLSIQRQMEGDNALLYEDDAWVAEIKAATVWNEEALIPLIEHYNSDDIAALLNKPKPRTYNKTKLNKEAKKGGEVKRIIDFAKQSALPELTIRQKGK